MAYNKVIYGGKTLIDLTGDTVAPATLLKGAIAHDKSGSEIEGSCTFDSDTSDATAAPAEILNTKSAYARGVKIVGTMPNRGSYSIRLSDKNQNVKIPNGYHDGSGEVSILAVEKEKIIADNIKMGVQILGVTGTLKPSSSVTAQSKTVTPSTSAQTILPDTGTDYLSQVVVNKIPYSETTNTAGGTTVTIAG